MNSGSQAILHGVPDGRSAAEVFWKLVLGSWKLVFGVGSSGDWSWYWQRV